eukprot:TRINITY_DN7051_c0_g1_i1.p1 TRINITY_DN7051_c0_g1~~TRINITY_DN7051_c0_g1_i1.p1  ORF type:complete len:407 (+),score=80.26 TRINITY_DN7051_c0_g1_i1:41-1261(+)
MDFNVLTGILPLFKKKQSHSDFNVTDINNQHDIDEVILIPDHGDIVRDIVVIDELRIASCADDHKILIVDVRFGDILFTLEGHTRYVSCMLYANDLLISGSADKTIRIWNVNTGECVKVIEVPGSISCIRQIDDKKFCCGGNMNKLLIYSFDGELLREEDFNEDENMYCLLPISNDRIAIGITSPFLLIYDYKEASFNLKPSSCRETIRCLEKIDDQHFVSGSMDGVVQIWDSSTLELINQLNYPKTYTNKGTYIYPVHKIRVIDEEFVAACYGQNFSVWKREDGTEVCFRQDAHESAIYDIISLYEGTKLVTCGADAEVKIWECPKPLRRRSSRNGRGKRRRGAQSSPNKIGNLRLHSNQIRKLLKCSESLFVSGGHDGLVIIWKDGEVERANRNEDCLYYYQTR